MKAFITTILATALFSISFGQERYRVDYFTSLSISSGVNVLLQESNSPSVENPENVPIDVRNESGTLVITMKKGSHYFKGKKEVIVNYTQLNSISVNGGANVHSPSPIRSTNLELAANGGGNLHCKLASKSTVARASGGGNIQLDGQVAELSLYASGGGNVHATEIDARSVGANASSGGNIKVRVNGPIRCNASSGGSIIYSGNPSSVNVNKSSGGRVVGPKSTATTTTKPSKPKVAY